MKVLIAILLCQTLYAAEPVSFHAQWWRKTTCKTYSQKCLPKVIAPRSSHLIDRPTFNKPSRLVTQLDDYEMTLLWKYHRGQPDYYAFQIELNYFDGRPIALCSRYEKIDPAVNHIPVGVCAGAVNEELLGVTLNFQ